MLYVDDGAFPFTSRLDMMKGVNLIFSHFAKFGLEMHIGKGIKDSKTECVFFPPPGYFDSTKEILHFPTSESDITIKVKKESLKLRIEREDRAYDNSQETLKFDVKDGFVSFTKHFKYLGACISYNLRDDHEIERRLAAASSSMGALRNFWRDDHVDNFNKQQIFIAIPINILLWGCETWAIRSDQMKCLEVFLHRSIRSIMGITMGQVKDERISNTKLRSMFYNIPTIENEIAKRQLTYIGKVFRNSDTHPPTKLLTAWCNNKRRKGAPLKQNKKSLVENIALIIPETDKQGSLRSWAFYALDDQYWKFLISTLGQHPETPPNRPPPSPSRPPPQPPAGEENEESREPQRTPPRAQSQPTPSPPPRRAPPSPNHRQHDPTGVGRNKIDSLRILGLHLNSTEREVRVQYRKLARTYHPDKHNPQTTGLSMREAENLFKLFNNAHSHLIELL